MLPQIWPAVLTLGWILLVIAAAEAMMALVSLAAGDGLVAAFAVNAAITAGVAVGCVLTTKGRPFDLRFRDAALLTVLLWVVVPAFAGLPLLAEPIGLGAADAYFEAVSGITTTGSTVMAGLDNLPPSILLWRSTIQWLGGFGIIALAIVILPFLKIGGMALFRLESSDRSEKALSGVRGVAGAVGQIYLGLTIACFTTYWLLGMTPFDALNHAFTSIPTAGFSTHDASFGHFQSPALRWAGVVFMLSGALPFLAYVRLLRRGGWRNGIEPQIIVLGTMLAVFTAVMAIWLWATDRYPLFDAATEAAFNITSVVTTTGYASADYGNWGAFAVTSFFLFMFLGGGTGSTSGGLKTFRLMVMAAIARQHIRQTIRPHVVVPLRYGSRLIAEDQAASVGTFVFLYFCVFAVVTALLAALGLDMVTALSAAAQAVGNVGPGLGPVVGPAGNFASLPDAAKLILAATMILGRLEILSVLLLFVPSFYR